MGPKAYRILKHGGHPNAQKHGPKTYLLLKHGGHPKAPLKMVPKPTFYLGKHSGHHIAQRAWSQNLSKLAFT